METSGSGDGVRRAGQLRTRGASRLTAVQHPCRTDDDSWQAILSRSHVSAQSLQKILRPNMAEHVFLRPGTMRASGVRLGPFNREKIDCKNIS